LIWSNPKKPRSPLLLITETTTTRAGVSPQKQKGRSRSRSTKTTIQTKSEPQPDPKARRPIANDTRSTRHHRAPRPETRDQRPDILDQRPETRDPRDPENPYPIDTRDPRPETRHFRPDILDQRPETQDPRPGIPRNHRLHAKAMALPEREGGSHTRVHSQSVFWVNVCVVGSGQGEG